MTRLVRSVAVAIALSLLFAATESKDTARKFGAFNRPNLLMYQPDDLPWLPQWAEGSAHRGDVTTELLPRYVPTPHMDRIRAEGAVFTNAHTAAPICASSRFSTVTSRYNSRYHWSPEPIWKVLKGSKEALEEVDSDRVQVNVYTSVLGGDDSKMTFAQDLKDAGYKTCMAGKWHLNHQDIPAFVSYEDDAEAVRQAGYDWVGGLFSHNVNKAPKPIHFSHNLEWTTAEAKKCISEAKAEGRPFLLYFNPTTLNQPDLYTALFEFSILETPNGTLDSVPDSGMPAREELWEEAKKYLTEEEIFFAEQGMMAGLKKCGLEDPGCFAKTKTLSSGIQYTASLVLSAIYTDAALGVTYDHLKKEGMLDDTLIVVSTDHGPNTKNQLLNGGSRIPYFVRYPALFPAGSTVDGVVSTVDTGRSFLDLAGVEPSYEMDGVSWIPAAKGQGTGGEVVYSEIDFDRAVIDNEFKYIHRGDTGNFFLHVLERFPGSGDIEQLYDMKNDPDEQVNLIDDPKYTAIVKKMRARLACFDSKLSMDSPDYSTTSTLACKLM